MRSLLYSLALLSLFSSVTGFSEEAPSKQSTQAHGAAGTPQGQPTKVPHPTLTSEQDTPRCTLTNEETALLDQYVTKFVKAHFTDESRAVYLEKVTPLLYTKIECTETYFQRILSQELAWKKYLDDDTFLSSRIERLSIARQASKRKVPAFFKSGADYYNITKEVGDIFVDGRYYFTKGNDKSGKYFTMPEPTVTEKVPAAGGGYKKLVLSIKDTAPGVAEYIRKNSEFIRNKIKEDGKKWSIEFHENLIAAASDKRIVSPKVLTMLLQDGESHLHPTSTYQQGGKTFFEFDDVPNDNPAVQIQIEGLMPRKSDVSKTQLDADQENKILHYGNLKEF